MDKASSEVWARYEEFVAGFVAARELHIRAGETGSFIESVCLGASIIDSLLRVALVLQYQLDNHTRDMPLELIYQGPNDKPIAEREIYHRALSSSVIKRDNFSQLEALYKDRNRVIHQYVIGRITTAEILDIAVRYDQMISNLSEQVRQIEEQQIRESEGITAKGPALEGEEGRRFLEEIADKKHTPDLAKLLRNSHMHGINLKYATGEANALTAEAWFKFLGYIAATAAMHAIAAKTGAVIFSIIKWLSYILLFMWVEYKINRIIWAHFPSADPTKAISKTKNIAISVWLSSMIMFGVYFIVHLLIKAFLHP